MMRLRTTQLALASLVLAACASPSPVRPPAGPASGPPTGAGVGTREAPPAPTGASAQASAARRGGFYLDDGPGDGAPVDLDSIADAQPRLEPMHRWANRPYVVFDRQYVPMTALGIYRERGVGSWYGRRFHGQRTSSGEVYDMYAMTAAHPTLPIPSYVRVTHVRNGRSVVVRVNDRGPFLHGRVIDLSWTAAAKLGYVQQGSAELEVELLSDPRLLQAGAPVASVAGSGAAAAGPTSGAPTGLLAVADSPATAPASANRAAPAVPPAPAAGSPMSAAPSAGPAAAPSTGTTAAPIPAPAPAPRERLEVETVLTPATAGSAPAPAAAPSTAAAPAPAAVPSPAPAAAQVPRMPAAPATPPASAPVAMPTPAASGSPVAASASAPAAKTAAGSVPLSGVYLQFGAFAQRANAQAAREQAAAALGLPPDKLLLQPDRALLRVLSGPYANREQALQTASRLRLGADLRPVPVMIKP